MPGRLGSFVTALAGAAMVAALAGPCRAELSLDAVHWQAAKPGKTPGSVVWEDAKELQDAPPRLDARLRARITLKNRGPKPAEGILLRYTMAARVSPTAGAGSGAWAIPFVLDERRVPKVGPNQTLDVPLTTSPGLELYAARLSRAGWWPDRLKIQVMLEPRADGQSFQTLESVLEVSK